MWRATLSGRHAHVFLTNYALRNDYLDRRRAGIGGRTRVAHTDMYVASEAVLCQSPQAKTFTVPRAWSLVLMIATFARRFSREECDGKIELSCCRHAPAFPSIQRNSFSFFRVCECHIWRWENRILETRRKLGRKTNKTDTNKSFFSAACKY